MSHTRTIGQGGFTLGELLTTVAIAGISLSFVIPGLAGAARTNARAVAVNELVATMHVARSEAITRNVQVGVCPSTDGTRCTDSDWASGWIRFVDGNRNGLLDPGEEVLGRQDGFKTLSIRSDAFARAFAYQPTGRIVAPRSGQHFGDFTICAGDGGFAQILVVNPAGEPRLADRLTDGSEPDCA